MKFKLETKEFVGYFNFVEDVLDFMSEVTKKGPWRLSDEETGKTIIYSEGVDNDEV
jgi:hypothetical protein